MNVICDCLRKNLNGGTCNCLDNLELEETDEWADEVDETPTPTTPTTPKSPGRMTSDWDDFLH